MSAGFGVERRKEEWYCEPPYSTRELHRIIKEVLTADGKYSDVIGSIDAGTYELGQMEEISSTNSVSGGHDRTVRIKSVKIGGVDYEGWLREIGPSYQTKDVVLVPKTESRIGKLGKILSCCTLPVAR